jgi:hypothetical protein
VELQPGKSKTSGANTQAALLPMDGKQAISGGIEHFHGMAGGAGEAGYGFILLGLVSLNLTGPVWLRALLPGFPIWLHVHW